MAVESVPPAQPSVVAIASISVAASFVAFTVVLCAWRTYEMKQRRAHMHSELKDVLLEHIPDSDAGLSSQDSLKVLSKSILKDSDENHIGLEEKIASQGTEVQMANLTSAGLSSQDVQQSSLHASTTGSATGSTQAQTQPLGNHPLQGDSSSFQLQNT